MRLRMYEVGTPLGTMNLVAKLGRQKKIFPILLDTVCGIVDAGEEDCMLRDLECMAAIIRKELEEREQRRKMKYGKYLETEHWQNCREEMIVISQHRCHICNMSDEETTLNVHHKTYERLGNEYVMDLVVLCSNCHAKFHDKLPKPQNVVEDS